MEKQTYNGWTTYETWNFMLWHHDYFQEIINEYNGDLEEGEKKLDYGRTYVIVEGFIDDFLGNDEIEGSFISDIVRKGIQSINIHEIVEHLLED